MSTLTPQQIGKRFERDLNEAFRVLQKRFGFAWHRFTDTHEAGNVVREQPSDYLVTTPGGLVFVEAKASEVYDHFIPSLLRPSQKGAIKQYAQMLEVPYYVLFRSDSDGRVDWINGKSCLAATRSKRVPVIASTRKKDLSEFLAEAWGLKPIRVVIKKYNLRYGDAA